MTYEDKLELEMDRIFLAISLEEADMVDMYRLFEDIFTEYTDEKEGRR